TLSLFSELAIMATLTLFVSLSASSVTAISIAMGFYILSRSMTTLQLIASSSDNSAVYEDVISTMMHAIALFLPGFDSMTLSSWLISPPASNVIFWVVAESLIY